MSDPPPFGSTSATARDILSRLDAEGRVRLPGLAPGARGWLASALCEAGAGPLLWVVADEAAAEDVVRAAGFFLGDEEQAAQFPLHQALPYDDLSPDRFITADRLAVLFRYVHGEAPALTVTSVPALMRLTMPREALDSASTLVLEGQELDREGFARHLVRAGYLNVPLVEDPGTFAVRGGTLDFFPPQLSAPVRIELLADEVERIRTFDPGTQRTIERLDSVMLGPVREILQDEAFVREALASLDRLADELDVPSHKLLSITRSLKDGIWFFGIEALLPAFHARRASLLDYLPAGTRLVLDDPGALRATADETWERIGAAYDASRAAGNVVFPPGSLAIEPGALEHALADRPHLTVGMSMEDAAEVGLETAEVSDLRRRIEQVGADDDPLGPLSELLRKWRKERLRVFVATSRPGRARELAEMLRHRGFPSRIEAGPFDPAWAEQQTPGLPVRLVPGRLPGGFSCPPAGVAFLPDAAVFGRPVRRPPSRARPGKLDALKPDDIVVHVDFGIGRFEGLTKLPVGGVEGDFLLLRYRGGDKLYLPVTRMNLVERYLGGEDPALSKLGGKTWERTKKRVHQALLEMADELIRVHAQRRARPGVAAAAPDEDYRAMAVSFPFEETPDQERAIHEVEQDLTRERAMDRLVCGDVGFGKTEVAIRAAYLTALSGRQTAVLVPTTVLALQHAASFRSRLQGHAVRVEMVSRLVRPDDQKAILQDLAAGKVDIIIGTHRLLMKDVAAKQLGLVVIDEEHRFGVRHKERLKQMKESVDVLSMTATPIPRTLQMSLSGLKDISVIQTPPPGRRAIRTLITRFSQRVIEEALRRELRRGGQVFFLHNWVRSLPAMQRFIQRAIPEARTALAHGQMGERKLEKVMTDFVNRDIDVLVCTSIIESGLDIPSANTILVNRADHFGLSQLHQIRGRVGRSGERAYAYFLIPGLAAITADARQRLTVLAEHAEVGAGYRVAAQDLEMRGSGNLLGKTQSGHIAAVGFELYSRLLERAVAEVRGQAASTGPDPEIKLPVAGYLPESFVPELEQRLELYARLSRAPTEDEVFEIERELVDRYGPAPPEVENLCELTALKAQLRRVGGLSLEMKAGVLHLAFDTSQPVDRRGLVRLAREQPDRLTVDPAGALTLRLDEAETLRPLVTARSLVSRLAGEATPE